MNDCGWFWGTLRVCGGRFQIEAFEGLRRFWNHRPILLKFWWVPSIIGSILGHVWSVLGAWPVWLDKWSCGHKIAWFRLGFERAKWNVGLARCMWAWRHVSYGICELLEALADRLNVWLRKWHIGLRIVSFEVFSWWFDGVDTLSKGGLGEWVYLHVGKLLEWSFETWLTVWAYMVFKAF